MKDAREQVEEGKWIFNHGIHRGTITSRDTYQPMKFDTKEEAMMYYREQREFYHSIGYQFWYAKLTSPDGKTSTLESNSNYDR